MNEAKLGPLPDKVYSPGSGSRAFPRVFRFPVFAVLALLTLSLVVRLLPTVAMLERRRLTVAIMATMVTIFLFITLQQTHTSESIRVRIGMGQGSGSTQRKEDDDIYRTGAGYINGTPTTDEEHAPKFAYVTFLSGSVDQNDSLEDDNYFVATRILVWQLLHNPTTRTNGIDVVVMVTPSVSESRRRRLAKDGAIIHSVDFLHVENDGWIKAEEHRWDDVITKLRAWQMTKYSRILMLDGDTMLRRPLDGVFHDKGVRVCKPKHLDSYTVLDGEAPLPPSYVMASLSEVSDSNHEFPPHEGTGIKRPGKMNAGFFMISPSLPVFEYYRSLLSISNAFDPKHPEQNLFNFAHRWDGPMPWTEVDYTWNIRHPTEKDFDRGLVSMHEKWWTQPYLYENEKVKDFLKAQRWEMKGWYDAWDLRHA